jgi:hypothetical protein
VSGLSDVISIATDGSQSTAVLRDGTVRFWGISPLRPADCPSRLIAGSSGVVQTWCPSPVPVEGIEGARSVELSVNYQAALLENGTVVQWNGYSNMRPTPIAGLENAGALALGSSHGCARLRDGHVRCFGRSQQHGEVDGTRGEIPIDTAVEVELP